MRFTVTLYLLLATSMAGCVSKQASLDEYVDPSIDIGKLEAIAVFPPIDETFEPQEVQHLNRKISQAILSRHSDMRIASDQDVQRVVMEQDVAGEWSAFLESYVMSGELDVAVLRKMGDALGVDGILLGQIVSTLQQDRDYEDSAGETRATVRFSLFDLESGKLAWKAVSEAAVEMQAVTTAAPPVRDAVEVAVDRIMKGFPE